MAFQDRTLIVPVATCLAGADLQFLCKYPNEVFDYILDLRGWLAINELTLSGYDITTSNSLKVIKSQLVVRNNLNVGVQIELGGGDPLDTEIILFKLNFVEGDVIDIAVKLQINPLPFGLQPSTPGTLAIGDMSLAIGSTVLAGFYNRA